MTYEQIDALLREHVGERVRLTYPSGGQKVGDVGIWNADWREPKTLMFADDVMGGEVAGAVRIEVMQGNGRYAPKAV